jgi:hypothetical protein
VNQRNTDRVQSALIISAFVFLISLTVIVGHVIDQMPRPAPPDPPPTAVAEEGEGRFFGGWHNSPERVDAVARTLAQPRFKETPAYRAFRGAPEGTVLLSDFAKKVHGGQHIPTLDQGDIGSCVGNGTANACRYLIDRQNWELLLAGKPFTPCAELVVEEIYGLARHEIGHDAIRGDGAVTAEAAKGVQVYGVLARGVYGKYDLTRYSVSLCREWGKKGLPDELEPEAKKSPVHGITMARTADEVAKALRQGYTVAVGSGVGFGNRGPYKRDSDGFLKASGSWGHCMAVIGVRAGKRPGFLFLNSWGTDWVGGPTGTDDNGKPFDIPAGSFWVDWKTADRMFGEGDCVIFADAAGFPVKDVLDDWFIAAPVPFTLALPPRDPLTRLPRFGGLRCDCFTLAF